MSRFFLGGWLGGWLGGPPAPWGSRIKKKWGWGVWGEEEREVGLSEVAFPGLGPGEGRLWNLFRKALKPAAYGFGLVFTPLACRSRSFSES